MHPLKTYLQTYYRDYFVHHRQLLWQPVLFCVLLVVAEYGWGYEQFFPKAQSPLGLRWLVDWLYVLLVWGGSLWLVRKSLTKKPDRRDWLLLLIGAGIYAMRSVYQGHFDWLQANGLEWSRQTFYAAWYTAGQIMQMLLVVPPLLILHLWLKSRGEAGFAGLKRTPIGGYLWLLMGAVPLVVLAATQSAFTTYYPFFARIFPPEYPAFQQSADVWRIAFFELFYALDFFSTELFFRGFLVLAFVRWLGPAAILPMAVFYVTIHFGKPLGETISSFFGGYLLGIFAYYSRSIWGGVLVHIGLAWLMELAGGLVRFVW